MSESGASPPNSGRAPEPAVRAKGVQFVLEQRSPGAQPQGRRRSMSTPQSAPQGPPTILSGFLSPQLPPEATDSDHPHHAIRVARPADGASAPRSLRRLQSGQVTTADEGKAALESIAYDHGRDVRGNKQLAAFKWLLIIGAGLLVGAIGYVLVQLQFFFVHLKIQTAEDVEAATGSALYATLAFVGISSAMIVIGGLLVIYVGPLAAGSGIPFMLAYLNGNEVVGFLSPRTFLTKFCGLVLCIAGGLPLGIEGPFIHMGALSASFVSRLPGLLGYTGEIAREVARPAHLRLIVACGGAAGVAAAFNAPIAGVLFVQQDAAAFWDGAVTLRSFVCCAAASFALNVCLSGFAASMKPHSLIDFDGTRDFTYQLAEVPPFVLLGIAGGLVGTAFTKMNVQLAIKRDALLAYSKKLKLLETLVLALIVSTLVFVIPRAFPCQDAYARDAATGALRWQDKAQRIGLCSRKDAHGLTVCREHGCPKGQYNELASLLLNAPESVIGSLFDPRPDVISAGVLGAFAALYFCLVTISYDASAVGGLFVPSMMIGSSLGRCFALGLRSAVDWDVQPSVFALVGAAAVLSGLTRYTLALVVLVVEATQNTTLLLPVILAVVLAKAVGDVFTESVYEQRLHRLGVPLIPDELDDEQYKLEAGDVMRRGVLTVRRYARVDKVYAYLLNSTHHGFPVVEHEARVMQRLRSGTAESNPWDEAEAVGALAHVDLTGDMMMHSLNAGSLRDNEAQYRVPTVAEIFRAGAAASSPRRSGGGDEGGEEGGGEGGEAAAAAAAAGGASPPAPPPMSPAPPRDWHNPALSPRRSSGSSPQRRPSLQQPPSTPTIAEQGDGTAGAEVGEEEQGGAATEAVAAVAAAQAKRKTSFRKQGSREEERPMSQNFFPEDDGEGGGEDWNGTGLRSRFIGMVTRAQLIHALTTRTQHASLRRAHKSHELEDGASSEAMAEMRQRLSAGALHHDEGRLHRLDLTKIGIAAADHAKLIDLSPYIDEGVLSILADTPLGRVHRLFRSVGLRHLVVTDTEHEVVGVITRKDLTGKTENVALPLEQPIVPAGLTKAVKALSRGAVRQSSFRSRANSSGKTPAASAAAAGGDGVSVRRPAAKRMSATSRT